MLYSDDTIGTLAQQIQTEATRVADRIRRIRELLQDPKAKYHVTRIEEYAVKCRATAEEIASGRDTRANCKRIKEAAHTFGLAVWTVCHLPDVYERAAEGLRALREIARRMIDLVRAMSDCRAAG